jgi:hypothetical protein
MGYPTKLLTPGFCESTLFSLLLPHRVDGDETHLHDSLIQRQKALGAMESRGRDKYAVCTNTVLDLQYHATRRGEANLEMGMLARWMSSHIRFPRKRLRGKKRFPRSLFEIETWAQHHPSRYG